MVLKGSPIVLLSWWGLPTLEAISLRSIHKLLTLTTKTKRHYTPWTRIQATSECFRASHRSSFSLCQSRLESREPYSFRYETDLNSPLGHCGPYICPQRERLTLSTLSFFTYISYVQIRYTGCVFPVVPFLSVASFLLLFPCYPFNHCPFRRESSFLLAQTIHRGLICHQPKGSHISIELLALL